MNAATILNSINHCVFLKNRDGKYLWVNEPFAKIAGIPSNKIVGMTDSDLIWNEQAEYFRNAELSVLDGEPLVNIERTITSAQGVTKIILSISEYKSDDGETIGVVGNFFNCAQQFFIVQSNGTFQDNKFYLEFTKEWLTAEELRVLYYLFQGFTAKKISDKTKKAVGTVGFHIENIKNKMGCQHKNEITEVAMRHGVFFDIISAPHLDDQDI